MERRERRRVTLMISLVHLQDHQLDTPVLLTPQVVLQATTPSTSSTQLPATTALKPPLGILLQPGEHNRVSVHTHNLNRKVS